MLNVPAHAVREYRQLLQVLEDVVPPCASNTEAWTGTEPEHLEQRANVVRACFSCPALIPCGRYATTAGEKSGVWGGTDRTPVRGRHRTTTTEEDTAA